MKKITEIYVDDTCPSHLIAVMSDYSAYFLSSDLATFSGEVSATTLAVHIRSGKARVLHNKTSSTVKRLNRRLAKEQKCQITA
jgi:hypothetical protein